MTKTGLPVNARLSLCAALHFPGAIWEACLFFAKGAMGAKKGYARGGHRVGRLSKNAPSTKKYLFIDGRFKVLFPPFARSFSRQKNGRRVFGVGENAPRKKRRRKGGRVFLSCKKKEKRAR
jgi:hypothetical protein